MRTSDTIGLLLKSKGENRILAIAPEQYVYEALEKMAACDVGALLVLSGQRLVGILSERDYGPAFQRDPGFSNHDQPGFLCEAAADRG
jgi:predicted transcriptional regulator